jgi:hypothetical protein
MGLVSFELATVFLGGHNSLSQLGTWKCRGYVRLGKGVEVRNAVSIILNSREGLKEHLKGGVILRLW